MKNYPRPRRLWKTSFRPRASIATAKLIVPFHSTRAARARSPLQLHEKFSIFLPGYMIKSSRSLPPKKLSGLSAPRRGRLYDPRESRARHFVNGSEREEPFLENARATRVGTLSSREYRRPRDVKDNVQRRKKVDLAMCYTRPGAARFTPPTLQPLTLL